MLKVREVFEVRGRGTIAVVEPPPPGIVVRVGSTLRRADGVTWTVDGIESGRAPALVLRGDVKPAEGDALEVVAPPPVATIRAMLAGLSNEDFLAALPDRCLGCGSPALPCHCNNDD